jgi:hypothetical protein
MRPTQNNQGFQNPPVLSASRSQVILPQQSRIKIRPNNNQNMSISHASPNVIYPMPVQNYNPREPLNQRREFNNNIEPQRSYNSLDRNQLIDKQKTDRARNNL